MNFLQEISAHKYAFNSVLPNKITQKLRKAKEVDTDLENKDPVYILKNENAFDISNF